MLQNDGKFVKVLNRIADLVGLNLLAILFCIPIVTIGASITAVYGCIFRIQEKKEGYLIKDFWKLFKSKFQVIYDHLSCGCTGDRNAISGLSYFCCRQNDECFTDTCDRSRDHSSRDFYLRVSNGILL